jgi:hypothetical protein
MENGGKVELRKMEGRRVEGKQEIGGGSRGYGGGRMKWENEGKLGEKKGRLENVV